jgi:hypothetical protein
MFNVVFADILTFITPGAPKEILTGNPGGTHISQGLLLMFAVLLGIPVAMVFLSRVLKHRVNRWANNAMIRLPGGHEGAVWTSGLVLGLEQIKPQLEERLS